jgi:hypothetical protein
VDQHLSESFASIDRIVEHPVVLNALGTYSWEKPILVWYGSRQAPAKAGPCG